MSFITILFLYATFIITVINSYGGLLAFRYLNAAKFDTTNHHHAQTTKSDQIKQIHENEIIGLDVQVISHWIEANKLTPLKFDVKQDNRDLARHIILQLLSQQQQEEDRHRLTALFEHIYGETNICLAKSVAKLTLVAIELDDPATLAVLTEVLLTCNDCSVLNFIIFSVNQFHDLDSLPHIEKSMEFETLLITTSAADDCRKQNVKDETVERFAVSALERINRLQAAAGFIVPASTHAVSFKKSAGRRISNSSTLTRSSGISSCLSPSVSSLNTSNTSFSNHAEFVDNAHKECTGNTMEMLQPEDASYYDIIKFKKDLLHIRLEADHLLNHFVIPLTVATKCAKDMDRVNQVNRAFKTLIFTCMATEQAFHTLQKGFVFYQLATQLASRLIDEAFAKLYQQSQINTYNQCHFMEFSTSSYKAMNIASTLLQAFPNYSATFDTLVDRCSKLGLAFEIIDSVWRHVVDIKSVIQESHNSLSMVYYSKDTSIESLKIYMSAVQSVFTSVHLCSSEKLQLLYETVKQHIEFFDSSVYSDEEKIVLGMVTSLLEDIDTIKLQISRISRDLVHLHDKKEFESNISQAKSWLNAMNYSLCLFIALEALFSFDLIHVDQEALQSRYVQFQTSYSEFTLTKYDKICTYFSKDYDAGLNYQMLGDNVADKKDEDYKLFDDLQSVADQTSKLLAYCQQVLLQRRAISKYIQQLGAVQDNVDMAALIEHSLAAMTSFQGIEYPQLNIEGLSNMFYYYHRDLYLCLSQSKIALFDNFLMG